MLKETEIAWLAGIFDGEGSARIYRRKVGSRRFWTQVQAVSNTDFSLIQRITTDLDELGVKYTLRKDINRGKPHYSYCGDVRINGRKSVQKFLTTILPYVTGKRKSDVEHVLSFLSFERKEGRAGWNMPKERLEEDERIYLSQNFRPRSSVDERALN